MTFRVIFLALYGISTVRFRYHARKAHGIELSMWRRMVNAPGWEEKVRITITGALPSVLTGGAAFAYVVYPDWMSWFTLPFPTWLRWVGVLCAVVAFVLRVWFRKILGKEWSPYLHLREDHRLLTQGPYRWIRHPIYVANVAFRTALILESANLIIALPNAALMALMYARVGKEEAMMIERFGDEYRAYMAHTGRFLPRLTIQKREHAVVRA